MTGRREKENNMTSYTYILNRLDVCSLTAQFIKIKIQTVSNEACIPLFLKRITLFIDLLKNPPLPRFQPVLRRHCSDYEIFFCKLQLLRRLQ